MNHFFHGHSDEEIVLGTGYYNRLKHYKYYIVQERSVFYRFFLHQHPYTSSLIQRLLKEGVSGLQDADTDYKQKDNGDYETLSKGKFKPELYADFFFNRYNPNTAVVNQPFPVKDLDFTASGAYAAYNWELFFHVPMTIAIHLSKNQRYAESQRWFHYLFDPTDDSEGPTPQRFWKVRPFQYTDVKKIEEILTNLVTGEDEDLRKETIRSMDAWKKNPFRPHTIARYRHQSYMYKTVMAYLDNLISWGDSLFRQDTGEAIDEALQIYVLAANILGPRPQPVPRKGSLRPQTYDNLRNDLNQFGTVMRDMEADLPFDLMPFPEDETGDNEGISMIRSLGKALYFCVPPNATLMSYWDTVADRLFKIRNSLNLQGIFRRLPLFAPPIDPAMLARAAASGLDIGAVVNGINQPLPLVRFRLLVQKAADMVQEVKSLGHSLLSVLEKEDAESLTILRARHEQAIMKMTEQVKYGHLQEARKNKEGVLKSLAVAIQRYSYYEQQLGKSADEIKTSLPEFEGLDKESLSKLEFDMAEPEIHPREIAVDIANGLNQSGGKIISSYEAQEMAKLKKARESHEDAAVKDKIAAALSLLPELGVDFQFWGIGGHMSFGGSALSRGMSFWASFAKTDAEKKQYQAGNASRIGNYSRREQDWVFQSNTAAGEIAQSFKQLRAAEIREAVAEQELKTHRQQMKHAEEMEQFLNEAGTEERGKTSNKALYTWMKREVRGLYSQCFQSAFDIAKMAERALQHELGKPGLQYLQYGYLSGKEGLLAGEKLFMDIKRMEMGYFEQNQREYELTKHISLLQIDPLALIQLRTTGSCTLSVPEAAFDMDGPGHYFRRIKTVSVSIPCVTGPYTGVNCKLTLLKSSIRKSSALKDGIYPREDAEDERFSDYFGSMQSIVTSGAQNDSGLFETSLNDERYLPFENSGVIGEWQLELPADPSKDDPAPFDYATISDVILHIRYTAREGGNLLRKKAVDRIKELITAGEAAGSVRLFSLRHEFPDQWAKFQTETPAEGERFKLAIPLSSRHFPFWTQGRLNSLSTIEVLVKSEEALPTLDVFDQAAAEPESEKSTLVKDTAFGGLLRGKLDHGVPETPTEEIQLFFDTRTLSNVWMALTWHE